jgi:thymidine kinase
VVDDLSIPVLCYGLRTNFRGELFEPIGVLMALADEINELKTICECGAKATMNLRIDKDGKAVREGASIEIGGNDRYVPLCRRHFFERFSAAPRR